MDREFTLTVCINPDTNYPATPDGTGQGISTISRIVLTNLSPVEENSSAYLVSYDLSSANLQRADTTGNFTIRDKRYTPSLSQ